MKRTILTILAVALMQLSAGAQAESVIFPFMEFSHDAIGAAMGGASILHSGNDVRAAYQNWAASSTTYADFTAAASFGAVDFSADLACGFSADAGANKLSDRLASLGVGYMFTESIGAEVTGRYCSTGFGLDDSAKGFNADALLKGRFGNASMAAGVTGLGPRVQGFRQPSAIALAAAFKKSFEEEGDTHAIEAELDVKYYLYGEIGASAGLEYCYNNLISVRAGGHAGGITGAHASVGLGLRFSGFHLDAYYLAGGQITNSFGIGLGYKF